jgi:hypothetical protein
MSYVSRYMTIPFNEMSQEEYMSEHMMCPLSRRPEARARPSWAQNTVQTYHPKDTLSRICNVKLAQYTVTEVGRCVEHVRHQM